MAHFTRFTALDLSCDRVDLVHVEPIGRLDAHGFGLAPRSLDQDFGEAAFARRQKGIAHQKSALATEDADDVVLQELYGGGERRHEVSRKLQDRDGIFIDLRALPDVPNAMYFERIAERRALCCSRQ